MNRMYISPIIGSPGGLPGVDPFRSAVEDILDPQTGHKAFVVDHKLALHPEGHPQQGLPVHDWCFVVAEGKKHDLARDYPGVQQLPDFGLAVRLAAMETTTKEPMLAALTARGIDVSSISDGDGYRALIRLLGRLHEPAFDEDRFSV